MADSTSTPKNHGCFVSTGICGSLTFGSGQLDHNGYWERPCGICARTHEIKHPEDGPCWPFSEKVRNEKTLDF
jgi:hypothetical protein